MCTSPFLGLKRKWCYKLLCNDLFWGFSTWHPQRVWETRFWPECKGCYPSGLHNLQVGQLRKMLVCSFPWARSTWARSHGPCWFRSDGAEGKAVVRQWGANANLQTLSLYQTTWRYHRQWLRALPSEASGFEFWLAHLLAVWPWADNPKSLSHYIIVFICINGICLLQSYKVGIHLLLQLLWGWNKTQKNYG